MWRRVTAEQLGIYQLLVGICQIIIPALLPQSAPQVTVLVQVIIAVTIGVSLIISAIHVIIDLAWRCRPPMRNLKDQKQDAS